MTLRPQLAIRFTKGGKIPAFTLAEVLVTLGIIGVVAAMTLPMLAKNYQFYVRQQQFKKAYAAMSIAVQKTQIDLGEGVKCYYKNWADTSNRDITECPYFYEELLRNIRVVAKCEGDALEKHCLPKDFPDAAETYAKTQGGDNPQAAKEFFAQSCGSFVYSYLIRNADVYVFNDFIIIPNKVIQKAALLTIDINGHKGPNKWGHDMFLFQFLKQKKYDSVFNLVPSQICHPLDVGGYYTKDFFNYLYGQNAEL
ncbi:hypothetical protein J6A31_02845 [bacterium]|nr:hypothetical protein [bacterium]